MTPLEQNILKDTARPDYGGWPDFYVASEGSQELCLARKLCRDGLLREYSIRCGAKQLGVPFTLSPHGRVVAVELLKGAKQ